MKNVRSVAKVSLLVCLIAVSGCGKDKDKSGQAAPQQAGQPQSSPAGAVMSPPAKNGVRVATPRDETEAAVAKDRIIKELKGNDFSTIYKQASAGFREVGPEQQFIAMWQKQLEETGAYKGAKEIGHSVRQSDGFLQFNYEIQYEKKKKGLRLTFGRSSKGVLELTGINQRELATNS